MRQFRYPYKQVVLETPAGKLEPGEDPDEAIRRELREETGVTADGFLKLGDFYPTPGYTGRNHPAVRLPRPVPGRDGF